MKLGILKSMRVNNNGNNENNNKGCSLVLIADIFAVFNPLHSQHVSRELVLQITLLRFYISGEYYKVKAHQNIQ